LEKGSNKFILGDDESVKQYADQQPHNEEEFEDVQIEGLLIDVDDIRTNRPLIQTKSIKK